MPYMNMNVVIHKDVEEYNHTEGALPHTRVSFGAIYNADIPFPMSMYTQENVAKAIRASFEQVVPLTDPSVYVGEDGWFSVNCLEDKGCNHVEDGGYIADYQMHVVISIVMDKSPLDELELEKVEGFYN